MNAMEWTFTAKSMWNVRQDVKLWYDVNEPNQINETEIMKQQKWNRTLSNRRLAN